MIGPGRPLDTDRLYIICVNSLGSCFGSTGPASPDPGTGRPYRLDFPELSVEDIVSAARDAVLALGVRRLYGVVGASLGGMAALSFAIQFPDQAERLVCISSACQASPFAIALRSLQREIIRNDAAWEGGFYEPGRGPVEGMRLARKLGLMSYRSASEWQERFGRRRVSQGRLPSSPFDIEFEVESYLEVNARKFITQFDANCYLYLSRAMDLFDVAEWGGTVEAGLARVKAGRTLVVGVETDLLFPFHQQREIAEGLRASGLAVQLECLPSIQGHDAFLVDKERFGRLIGAFFAPG
jgi:homoserine O-acetyltransferase